MKTVKTKWQTEGELAVIYLIGNILVYYSKDEEPHFKRNQLVSLGEVEDTAPYKVTVNDNNLPRDAYLDLVFSWS